MMDGRFNLSIIVAKPFFAIENIGFVVAIHRGFPRVANNTVQWSRTRPVRKCYRTAVERDFWAMVAPTIMALDNGTSERLTYKADTFGRNARRTHYRTGERTHDGN